MNMEGSGRNAVGNEQLLLVSPSALRALPSTVSRAGNGTRTRDPNLGKVVLYQLSYSRTTAEL